MLGTEKLILIIGPERQIFQVHWKLLCARLPFFAAFYKAQKPIEYFCNPRGKVETHILLVDYLYYKEVPSGPRGVRRRSAEGKSYMAKMHDLFCLAKGYRANDLMNRVIDRIQEFDHRCGGTMYRSQLHDIWTRTTSGSPLRRYYAIASASFLRIATISTKDKKRRKTIEDLRKHNNHFKLDLGRARTTLKKNRLRWVDFRDQTTFGTCEFHIHRARELCHLVTQASENTVGASADPYLAQEESIRSGAAEDTLDATSHEDSSSEEASVRHQSDSQEDEGADDAQEDEVPEHEGAISMTDFDIVEESMDVGGSSDPSHPVLCQSLQTPESMYRDGGEQRYRERAPSAETTLGDLQVTGLDIHGTKSILDRGAGQRNKVRHTNPYPNGLRTPEGQKAPPQSHDSAIQDPLSTHHHTPFRLFFKNRPPGFIQKTPVRTIFISDDDDDLDDRLKAPSSSASHCLPSLEVYDYSKVPADGATPTLDLSPTQQVFFLQKLRTGDSKEEEFGEDIYTATPPPTVLSPSHNRPPVGMAPVNAPKGPRKHQNQPKRGGQKKRWQSQNRNNVRGVRKRNRSWRRPRRSGKHNRQGGAGSAASSSPVDKYRRLVLFKPDGRQQLANVHPDRLDMMTDN